MIEPELLPFDSGGGGSCPVQYEANFENRVYYIRYRHGRLSIDCDDREIFGVSLAPDHAHDGYWSDEETNVYLRLISDAVRQDAVVALRLPSKAEVAAHPYHHAGPLPRYFVCLCKEKTPTHRHHVEHCYSDWTLSAKELHDWRVDHGDDFEHHPNVRNSKGSS